MSWNTLMFTHHVVVRTLWSHTKNDIIYAGLSLDPLCKPTFPLTAPLRCLQRRASAVFGHNSLSAQTVNCIEKLWILVSLLTSMPTPLWFSDAGQEWWWFAPHHKHCTDSDWGDDRPTQFLDALLLCPILIHFSTSHQTNKGVSAKHI